MTKQKNNISTQELSYFALFTLIFGSMMGSGVFDIPQNMAHKSGLIAILISWFITAIGILSLVFSLTYLTLKKPNINSGIYGYAKYGFNDYIGFNSAWGYWLNAVLGNASYIIYIFATLSNFMLFKFFQNGDNFYSLIAETILIWGVYLLILRGIKEASLVNIIVSSIKIITLIFIIIIFICGFKKHQFQINLQDIPSFSQLLTQIKSNMLVTVWDFLGIEAACIYAIRAKNMHDVAKATTLGVLVVLIIDILISVIPFGIIDGHVITNLGTPSTASLLLLMHGSIISKVISAAIIISVIGALLAWNMLATNIIYLAALDNSMPQSLTKLNNKQVPKNSLLLSTITLQLFILFAYFTNSVYLIMIQLATSLILVPYLLVGIYAFKVIIFEQKINYLDLIKSLLAIMYGIWIIYAGGLKYLLFSAILYSMGSIIYIYTKKKQKKPIFNNKTEILTWFGLILITVMILLVYLFHLILQK
jgi:arginine:ornithine antiporter/lysine permease